MPTAGNPKITVRLDEATKARVAAAAHNAGLTSAGLVMALLLWYLGDGEPPQRPSDQSQLDPV